MQATSKDLRFHTKEVLNAAREVEDVRISRAIAEIQHANLPLTIIADAAHFTSFICPLFIRELIDIILPGIISTPDWGNAMKNLIIY